MAKIINHYENDLDKAWYDSSNILYSECDDKENDLKTLRITFKGGRTYEYYNVKVTDYLLFRESPSQGEAFNRLIKQHQCERIEDRDMDLITEEMNVYLNAKEDKFSVEIDGIANKVIVKNNDKEEAEYNISESAISVFDLKDLLEKIKIEVKTK